MYGSKSREIFLMHNYFLIFSFSSSVILLSVFSPFFNFLGSGSLLAESQDLEIFIKPTSAVREFDCSLCISFSVFLVLFGLQNGKFLFFDPFSINITFLHWCFLSNVIVDLNTFVLVIFFKS